MGVTARLRSNLAAATEFVFDRRRRITFMVSFFSAAGALAVVVPDLRPVVAAAALVLPLRILQTIAVTFEETDYQRFSPMLANATNYRFVGVTVPVAVLPVVGWYVGVAPGWSSFGPLALVVGSASTFVLTWSEGLYQKNFYFDRWHPVERFALGGSAVLSIAVSPQFLPLFLIFHRVITKQFQYPGIGQFNGTHSRLPQTMLLILGGFAIVGLFTELQPEMVLMLLFSGYAAQYYYPGIAKLKNGPVYYARHNNPVFMFLNAYQIGWLSWLDESTVSRIGRYSERVKPLLNLTVLAIEIGTVLILLWYPLAIVIVSLTLLLHILIFLLTGDDFWKWMGVDISLLAGLLLLTGQSMPAFSDPKWFLLSLPFIIAAKAWMNPVSMDWLDPPYVEYFSFEADLGNGETIPLNTNVFRPYDSITTQGATGTLTYLGRNPRITYSHGAITENANKDLHPQLLEAFNSGSLEPDTGMEFVAAKGVDMRDDSGVRAMREFLLSFLEKPRSLPNRILRFLSSPREFYSTGCSDRESNANIGQYERVRIYRVDGVWTTDGFEELDREEVLSVGTRA